MKPCFSEILSVRYAGKWSEVKEQFELRDNDFQLWLKKKEAWDKKRYNDVIKGVTLSIKDWRFLDMEFRHRPDLNEDSLIPDLWKPILDSVEQNKENEECENDIIAIDVIIIDGKWGEPVKVKTLHGALLIRGMSAFRLSEYCFLLWF